MTNEIDHTAFGNAREAAEWLKKQGWKVSPASAYRAAKTGKLRPEDDGTFSMSSVEMYAARYLIRLDSKKKLDAEELQARKQKAETLLREEQRRLVQLRRLIEEGKYMRREDFFLEMAARGAVLDATFRFEIQTKAGDLIDAVGGNQQCQGDLILRMSEWLDNVLNQFCTTKEFHVLFRPPQSVTVDGDCHG